MDNFFDALKMLGEENSVETEILIEKVKSAMLKAAKRAYPHSEDRIRVEIDPTENKFAMYIVQEIIDDEPIDENEINIEAAKTIDPNAVVGGTILKEIDISKLGRMAALSAKQSIKGDLREINREQMLNKFEKKEHDCIIAKVSQISRSNNRLWTTRRISRPFDRISRRDFSVRNKIIFPCIRPSSVLRRRTRRLIRRSIRSPYGSSYRRLLRSTLPPYRRR